MIKFHKLPQFSWFFENATRQMADRLLLAEDNPPGTFMVRPSEGRPNELTLSLKSHDPSVGYRTMNYRIYWRDNSVFVTADYKYPTLHAFITAYRSKFISILFLFLPNIFLKRRINIENLVFLANNLFICKTIQFCFFVSNKTIQFCIFFCQIKHFQ